MNRLSRWIAGFWMIIAILALTGCQSDSGQAGPQATVASPGFTAEAIVTYYDPQQVRYLTGQEHRLGVDGQILVDQGQRAGSDHRMDLIRKSVLRSGPGENPGLVRSPHRNDGPDGLSGRLRSD